MAEILILGAGMVGSMMAIDLARDGNLEVSVADHKPGALAEAAARVDQLTGRKIATVPADLSERATVTDLAADSDIVLGALSSTLGLQTLRAVIESGTPYVDISFMRENPLELDQLAKSKETVAVIDCGVAPGMSNILAAHSAAQLDRCETLAIYVGGVPRDPKPPFFYKAAFSPADVIEEYTRPARIVENGGVVTREALSEAELINFDNLPAVGTLEAFFTDGLRTLIDTLDVPDMTEKTLRHRGHADLMRIFRETGLFGQESIDVAGTRVRPIDVTSALLFPKWRYEEGEPDLTVMRVIGAGERNGRPARVVWELFDDYDAATGCTSMSRTTAFPATIVAREILAGRIGQTGVIPPEGLVTESGLLDRLLSGLRERGVVVNEITS